MTTTSPTKPILPRETLDRIRTLTDVEYALFQSMGEGLKPLEISRLSGKCKSIKTIETQIVCIAKKLGVENSYLTRVIATRFLVYKEQTGIVEKSIFNSSWKDRPRREFALPTTATAKYT